MFGFEERFAMFDVTPVDNQFILEYLPAAKGDYVRVYIYGLMRCYHPENMSVSQMAHELNLTEEEILAAFRYWERKGLVHRVNDCPPEYRYVNVKQNALSGGAEVVDPAYEAFAQALYGVFGNARRLHGEEIRTCYEWTEDLKLSMEVIIMLLKYMAKTHGKDFSMLSAQKLACRMADEQVTTMEDAEAFFSRDEEIVEGTKRVLKRLGKRNPPSEDQLRLYSKWLREWNFTSEAIEEACAETVKGDPNMGYLDGILRNMHEKNAKRAVIAEKQVQESVENSRKLRNVLHLLGTGSVSELNLELYGEMEKLYPQEVIELAARECARSEGNPEDVLKLLQSWKKKGLQGAEDVGTYIAGFRAQGEILKELRACWGLKGRMGAAERKMLGDWQTEWHFPKETILACAPFASGTERPMQYLDAILKKLAEKGLMRPEEAVNACKTKAQPQQNVRRVAAQQYEQRDYSGMQESPDELFQRLNGGNDHA